MFVSIYFGKAIKHKTSNYKWLTCEKEYKDTKEWTKDIDNPIRFVIWLKERFQNEAIDRHDFRYENKSIVAVKYGDIDDYQFFSDNGKFAEALLNYEIDEIYEEFSNSIDR